MTENIDDQRPDNQRDLLFGQWTRHYQGLGLSGVIAIPNTTDADWLVYFEQWLKQMGLNFDNLNSDFDALVTEFNKLSASIPGTISDGIETKFGEERPGMVEEVYGGIEDKVKTNITNPIQEQVDEITSQNDGIPKLFQMLYGADNFNADSAASAEFILNPRLTRNAVMQSIMYDASLGQFFITQADGKTTEGFVITRLSAGGELLSQMWLPQSGHGTAVFLRSRSNNSPIIFYQRGASYYKVPYGDNQTYQPESHILAFTPPMNGNGMSSYNSEYMTHINNQSAEHLLSIYPATYSAANNNFVFPGGKTASIDISNLLTGDNVLQGIVLLRKSEIIGSAAKEMIVFIATGAPDTHFNLLSFEFNPETGEFKQIKTITDIQDTVKPLLASNNISWGDAFEPEGLTRISIDGGGRNEHYVHSLVYGISAGVIGKRAHYLFGFSNPMVSNFITNARNSFYDISSTGFSNNVETALYNMRKPGIYEIPEADMLRMIDCPDTWSGIKSQADWTLEVKKPNQNGDLIQVIYRRGYTGSKMEQYIRSINFTAGTYGDGYKPSIIGVWNTVITDGQQTLHYTSTNNAKFKTLDDFNIPGVSFYVSAANGTLNITDFNGAASYLANRGFKITTESWSGGGDYFKQTIEIITNGGLVTILKRNVPARPSTYGPAMIAGYTTLPTWSVIQSTALA